MANTMKLRQLMVRLPTYLVLSLIYFRQSAGSESVLTSGCVCPGDTLSYECIATGYYAATIWTGSAFNYCDNNEIVLLHSRFDTRTYWTCNNGAIVGRSLSVEGNNYTSQLNVTVTPDIAGTTIECASDNGTHYKRLFTSTIPTVTGPLLPPNTLEINNADLSLRQLTFSWSPVAPHCPAIHYNILASNCGSCPTTTNHTNVTCTNISFNGTVCIFAVQTVVCGNITGNVSDPISIIFYASEQSTPISNLDSIKTGMHNLNTNTAYITSIGLLATALMVCIVVFIIVITIILIRSKAKTEAALQQSASPGEIIDVEPTYEDIIGSIPSESVIDTQDNVAYGHTQTTTAR